jgi:hypothetical protein
LRDEDVCETVFGLELVRDGLKGGNELDGAD